MYMFRNTVFESWLQTSKITLDVAEMFGISYSNKIIFPVHDTDGTFLFNKYRRSPEDTVSPKYTYDVGGKVSLYAWHKAKEHKQIVCLEGEKDVLVSWSHNIPAVTSTGGALSFQKDWVDLFFDKEVIILLDNDKAGGEGTVKILDMLPKAKVAFIPDMPNVKDVSDYVNVGGDLQELLKTAKHFNDIAEVQEDRLKRLALFQSVYFHDAYIKKHTKVVYKTERKQSYNADKVTRAKEYPITQLIEFDGFKKTICPFHNEKSASLVYYPRTNTCYCFGGCGRAYDSIDIYRHIHNCTFTEAVNYLSNN